MAFRLVSLVVWLAFCLTVTVPVDAQEGGHTVSAKPPQTGSVMPVPDTLTGSSQAAVRVWGVAQTVQPYAAAFLVTHNRTGKYGFSPATQNGCSLTSRRTGGWKKAVQRPAGCRSASLNSCGRSHALRILSTFSERPTTDCRLSLSERSIQTRR